MREPPFGSIDQYKEVINHALFNAHKCPQVKINELFEKHDARIKASFDAGNPAIDVIKAIYDDWKKIA